MIPVFLREEKHYTKEDLIEKFCCTEEDIAFILGRLKKSGVLKPVKPNENQDDFSDILDEDIEIDDVETGKKEYKFTFVGVIALGELALMCYPKYLLNATAPKKELKQVLEVLEKFNSKKNQIIHMFDDTTDSASSNMLAVMLFLLQDYFENGVYTSTQDIIETNGSGEINWDKTINETFVLISNNRPYYPELQTIKRVNDDFDFFKRLHECILTRCSEKLADLLDLFGITSVNISDEQLEDFGDTDYVLDRISKELNVQFNTRKQFLLKTLYAYISHSKTLDNLDYFSMFGTNKFDQVWEQVCQDVMDDQLQKKVGVLLQNLSIPLTPEYKDLKGKKLIELIDKPQWVGIEPDGDSFVQEAEKTLIPDLISIVKDGDEYQFIIFDAKYYNIRLERDKLSGQPGIESITKQYLYELAYRPFLKAHGIKTVKNCFLMPTDGDEIIEKGLVKLEMLKHILKDTGLLPTVEDEDIEKGLDALKTLKDIVPTAGYDIIEKALNTLKMLKDVGLQDIQIRLLPADQMYQKYLDNEKMDISELNLWPDARLQEIEGSITTAN